MTTLIRSMNMMLRLLVPGAVLILMPGHSHAQSGPDYGPLREAVQSSGPIVVSVLLSSEAPMAARVQADSEIGNLQDVEVIHSFVTSPGMSVRVTSEEAVEALANHPMVERVDISPAGAAHLMDSRSIVGAEEAYAAGFDGEGSTVSILDTGIERNHTDLADDLVAEACICNTGIGCCPNGMSEQIGPGSAPDDTGHGTHVSGIVTSDGTLAPRGIAPQAGVVMVRMMNGALFDSADDITASLEWVLENHPESDSVNMSLGTFQRYPANCDIATDTWTPPAFIVNMANAVQALRDAGVTAVASSGNDADKAQTAAPACLSNVVAVGADQTGGGDHGQAHRPQGEQREGEGDEAAAPVLELAR